MRKRCDSFKLQGNATSKKKTKREKIEKKSRKKQKKKKKHGSKQRG
jgi:hypothetical protein